MHWHTSERSFTCLLPLLPLGAPPYNRTRLFTHSLTHSLNSAYRALLLVYNRETNFVPFVISFKCSLVHSYRSHYFVFFIRTLNGIMGTVRVYCDWLFSSYRFQYIAFLEMYSARDLSEYLYGFALNVCEMTIVFECITQAYHVTYIHCVHVSK